MKTKNKKLKSIALPAWISGIFGVTEPAIYGVTLTRIPMFVISCVGAGLAGIWYGFTGLLQWTNAGLGVFAIPGFLKEGMDITQTIIYIVIGIAIAMISAFILAFVLFKDDVEDNKIVSPADGTLKPLDQVHDEVFSTGAMGNGVCLEPTSNTFKAPASGTLTTLFPTLHAFGITTNTGDEILVHIGLDTVNLNGKYFKALVKQGQKVKVGDSIVEVDLHAIQEAGYHIETPIIVTATDGHIENIQSGEVQSGKMIYEIKEG